MVQKRYQKIIIGIFHSFIKFVTRIVKMDGVHLVQNMARLTQNNFITTIPFLNILKFYVILYSYNTRHLLPVRKSFSLNLRYNEI